MKIALLGLGTVGTGLLELIDRNKAYLAKLAQSEIEIAPILVRQINKKRDIIGDYQITDNEEIIFNDPEINLIIELIGGEEPAYTYIKKALQNQISVITANKLIIAKYGKELQQIAVQNKVKLDYEASVGGGIPLFSQIDNYFNSADIKSIYGILNGTTNYILTEMENKQISQAEVLLKAQKLGYAEQDPTSDLDGYDALYKIIILARHCFARYFALNKLSRSGITEVTLQDINIANQLGYKIKLLAKAEIIDDKYYLDIRPTLLKKENPLAQLQGVDNGLLINTFNKGDYFFAGPGAGKYPTALAVFADLKNYFVGNKNLNTKNLIKADLLDINVSEHNYYFNIKLKNTETLLKDLKKEFKNEKIEIRKIVENDLKNDYLQLIILTEKIKYNSLNNLVKIINEKYKNIFIINYLTIEGE